MIKSYIRYRGYIKPIMHNNLEIDEYIPKIPATNEFNLLMRSHNASLLWVRDSHPKVAFSNQDECQVCLLTRHDTDVFVCRQAVTK